MAERTAIAIVHTHPRRASFPSRLDHETADRLGIPVLLLTPNRIVAALPGVWMPRDLLHDAHWTDARDPRLRCTDARPAPLTTAAATH